MAENWPAKVSKPHAVEVLYFRNKFPDRQKVLEDNFKLGGRPQDGKFFVTVWSHDEDSDKSHSPRYDDFIS